jgi:hypothetical protein
MPIYTSEMIWNELQAHRKILETLLERDVQNNIDEVSLSKAAKLIHRSSEILMRAVRNQELYVMTHTNSKNQIRYRFRVCDLFDWQKRRRELYTEKRNIEIESTDDMIKRIFRANNPDYDKPRSRRKLIKQSNGKI